ncbi:uncharacterized protein LOC107627980 [Arachis ipaensis]|uniref:uncharacterized protein LOC107627980 n=1 Tax=Arachis ipaensis TaxID=130454 RepID=UPI0007AFCA7E|nr:uncharacterized protein LOC107627980 [Arachis ipaensis]
MLGARAFANMSAVWFAVEIGSLRIVLSIAAVQNWHLHQLDVNTAFLHGDLSEKVYMKHPPVLNVSSPNMVCRLDRSLYGLKQASRQWNSKLCDALRAIGFQQSRNDYSLFTKDSKGGFTVILVYVDDLIVTGTDLREIEFIKHHLHELFRIKDLEELKFFLGLEVARCRRGITVCQRKYCIDLLKEYGLLEAKTVSTPMDYTVPLSKNSGTPLSSTSEYRKLVGKLLYLTNTRPEIGYAVGKLSQFLDCATDKHFEAAIRVLRYLKGAPALGLMFSAHSDLEPAGYSDSDWGTCSDSKRSISGYCFFFGNFNCILEE